jgi:predicted DNA-binding protein with PD1-like motif
MRSKRLNDRPRETWVLAFDPGDEPISLLLQFATKNDIRAAQISGIGGFSDVKLAFFDLQDKEYKPIPLNEQVEVMSLLGNISRYEGKPKLHVHCIVGKRDGSAMGGHLLEAHVRPTLEVFVTAYQNEIERVLDPTTNLPLLKP